jgi:hypothetical protein
MTVISVAMTYGCSSRYFLRIQKMQAPENRLVRNSHQRSDPSCPPQRAATRYGMLMLRSEYRATYESRKSWLTNAYASVRTATPTSAIVP